MKVGGEDAMPVVDRQRLETPPRDVDARGIDQHVDLAEAREDGRAHRGHRLG